MQILKISILVFALLLFVLLLPNQHIKQLPAIKTFPKVAIILTLCANSESKIKIYSNVLNQWLQKSSMIIYTVDSSGSQQFSESNHPRWKAFSFTQSLNKSSTVSALEVRSIQQAFNAFKHEWSNLDILVKLTCKYYIPELESALKQVPLKTDLILQHRFKTYWFPWKKSFQNSELFAIHPSQLQNFFTHFFTRNLLLEQSLYAFNVPIKYRFPKLEVSDLTRYPRSTGDILTFL